MIVKIFRKNKNGVHKITLDEQALELYQKHKWTFKNTKHTSYLYRHVYVNGKKYKTNMFHRELLQCTDRKEVIDHINGDGLDNRKNNIRICTQAQNMSNQKKQIRATSSKYKGVKFDKSRNLWHARIKPNSKEIFLGRFDSEHAAAIAYNIAAKKYFGDFANINKIRKEY